MGRRAVCGLALACLALPGCAAPPEQIVLTAAGRGAPDADVDGDPWRLLPGGAVAWVWLDAKALAAASFGTEANQVLVEHLPLSSKGDFNLGSDVDQVVLGMYATAGADAVAVARGRFDREGIAAAIAADPTARNGRPIQVNSFAGRKVYVTDGWAMVPVTKQTLVFGSEVGVRRVLERIEEGRLLRSLPSWYEQMLAQKTAALVLGVDLDAQPVPSVLRTKLAFLEGMRAGRLLGNFSDPGMHLAGTLTYDSPESAVRASAALEAQAAALRRAEMLLAMLKMPRPIRSLETRATGKDTQVTVAVDGRAIAMLLTQTDEVLGRIEQEGVLAPTEPAPR
ncbi:MAG TPA: hypothetical protein VLC09_20430 [Polyangiaceae bacterium]|nr:hypothetical protein [Polyangiaceae bacterium]